MRISCGAVAALLFLQAPAAAMAGSCSAKNARYVQAGSSGVTATLVPAGSDGTAASDLLFIVKLKAHAYRFRFQQSNGYGGISIEPIRQLKQDREGQPVELSSDMPDIRFIPYRADLTEMADAPRSDGQAPQFIVLPELGSVLWYDASALGGPKQREAMSRSAFALSGCDRETGSGNARR